MCVDISRIKGVHLCTCVNVADPMRLRYMSVLTALPERALIVLPQIQLASEESNGNETRSWLSCLPVRCCKHVGQHDA